MKQFRNKHDGKRIAKRVAAFIDELDTIHGMLEGGHQELYDLRGELSDLVLEAGYVLTYDGGHSMKFFSATGKKGKAVLESRIHVSHLSK